jgi:hypothetical protein
MPSGKHKGKRNGSVEAFKGTLPTNSFTDADGSLHFQCINSVQLHPQGNVKPIPSKFSKLQRNFLHCSNNNLSLEKK